MPSAEEDEDEDDDVEVPGVAIGDAADERRNISASSSSFGTSGSRSNPFVS